MREDNPKHKVCAPGGMVLAEEKTTPGTISSYLPTGKNYMPNIVHVRPKLASVLWQECDSCD